MMVRNTQDIFGEIRSCVHGAECDIGELSVWVREVEEKEPHSGIVDYVITHLGGSPRLWWFLASQPLDALELLQFMDGPDEHEFVSRFLPRLILDYESLKKEGLESSGLSDEQHFKAFAFVMRTAFSELIPDDSAMWQHLEWLNWSFDELESNRELMLNTHTRTIYAEIRAAFVEELWERRGVLELGSYVHTGGCWEYPRTIHEDYSLVIRGAAALLMLIDSLWESVLYTPLGGDWPLAVNRDVALSAVYAKAQSLIIIEEVEPRDSEAIATKRWGDSLMKSYLLQVLGLGAHSKDCITTR